MIGSHQWDVKLYLLGFLINCHGLRVQVIYNQANHILSQ